MMERFETTCECPNCGELFISAGLQAMHSYKTGHDKVERCHESHPRTKRSCERLANHDGSHGYIGYGGNMKVYF